MLHLSTIKKLYDQAKKEGILVEDLLEKYIVEGLSRVRTDVSSKPVCFNFRGAAHNLSSFAAVIGVHPAYLSNAHKRANSATYEKVFAKSDVMTLYEKKKMGRVIDAAYDTRQGGTHY